MEQLYEKYKNIQLFATAYRNFSLIDDEFYDYEMFKNKMHGFEYVLHKFSNPKASDRPVDIYLFKSDSKYISNTVNFKKILDRYNNDHTIIMITKEELNIYRKKMIMQYSNLIVKNYFHKHFIMEINKGPLCSVHTVLTPDEVRVITYNIMAHGHKLPAILESDPQNIWIGGEINDLIKIESYSEITGKVISYRIVTPSSGKTIQNPASNMKKNLISDDNEVSVDNILNKSPLKKSPLRNSVTANDDGDDDESAIDNEDYAEDYNDSEAE